MKENNKASILLDKIKEVPEIDKIDIGTLIKNNSGSPYFIVLFVTILVLAPIPFVSNIFSIISVIIMYQVIIGKKSLILPKFVLNIKIRRTALVSSIEKISPLFRKIEFFTKNRMLFLTNKRFIDIFLFILSVLSASPVPFIGIFSCFAIFFTIFGFLNKDGLFILISIILAIINFNLNVMLILFGKSLLLRLFFS